MFSPFQPAVSTDQEKINEILTRGVEEIFIKESLEKKLRSGVRLRVKLGFDPTSPHIHIGRAIVLRKLRAFQDLGHTVVFIVGDFTARIGDASDKLEKRPMQTEAQVNRNIKTYKEQVGKIIDLKRAEFHYNSKWLSKLKFTEIAELAESFSVLQMSNRRNFKDRLDKGEEVSLREFLYPLMQGYDSVMVKADIELGGFDQLFNLKAGRTIQKHYGMPEQDIMTTSMLEGTDGRKMSSSWGNIIALTDSTDQMYGKLMAVRDDLIPKYLMLTTNLSGESVASLEKELREGKNPRDVKMILAREVVMLYHGKSEADRAEKNFIKTFSEGGVPENISEVKIVVGILLSDLLLQEKIVESKTEFTRLVKDGAVSLDGVKVEDPRMTAMPGVLKVGKRRFLKIVSK
jgi:tyrosyl-tRNA synthetase